MVKPDANLPVNRKQAQMARADAQQARATQARGAQQQRAQGKPLRAIAETVAAKGHRLSHEGVAGVLKVAAGAREPKASTLLRRLG
jgi:hypothetical protein